MNGLVIVAIACLVGITAMTCTFLVCLTKLVKANFGSVRKK